MQVMHLHALKSAYEGRSAVSALPFFEETVKAGILKLVRRWTV